MTYEATLSLLLASSLGGCRGRFNTVPTTLAPFQVAAWWLLDASLRSWGGALLADEPGCGKTRVAVELLRLWGGGVVCARAHLLPMWGAVLKEMGVSSVVLRSHTSLLHDDAPSSYPLIVVDEAHAFASEQAQRREALRRFSSRAPLLLLSATPLGLDGGDLLRLLRLFVPPGGFLPLLGKRAEEASPEEFGVLGRSMVVRRTRTMLQGMGLEESGLGFPRRSRRTLSWEVQDPALWRAIDGAVLGFQGVSGMPAKLLLSWMCQRLEAGPEALYGSLNRLQLFLRRSQEALAQEKLLNREAWKRWFGGREDGGQGVFSFFWEDDALEDARDPVRSRAELVCALESLEDLQKILRARTENPKHGVLTSFLEDALEKRVLVVGRSVESMEGLWRALSARFSSVSMGFVTGESAFLSPGNAAARQDVLLQFRRGDLRWLLASDLLSEGSDMPWCDLLVEYDLPWNPRLSIQRQGRGDRLGKNRGEIELVSLEPGGELEKRLNLVRRRSERSAERARVWSSSWARSTWGGWTLQKLVSRGREGAANYGWWVPSRRRAEGWFLMRLGPGGAGSAWFRVSNDEVHRVELERVVAELEGLEGGESRQSAPPRWLRRVWIAARNERNRVLEMQARPGEALQAEPWAPGQMEMVGFVLTGRI